MQKHEVHVREQNAAALSSEASVCTCSLAEQQLHNPDAQVREQNPKLAKQSRVLKVSMDNVYDFAVTPEVDKKTAGVSFRFMPDLKQVQKALEVRPLSFSGLRQESAVLWPADVLAGHHSLSRPCMAGAAMPLSMRKQLAEHRRCSCGVSKSCSAEEQL